MTKQNRFSKPDPETDFNNRKYRQKTDNSNLTQYFNSLENSLDYEFEKIFNSKSVEYNRDFDD